MLLATQNTQTSTAVRRLCLGGHSITVAEVQQEE